jgi:hypothetical protein
VRAGTTFLLADPQLEKHLWVVLSDTEKFPNEVVLVSFTTAAAGVERACVVQRDEHPGWLTHESCIAYKFTRVVTLKMLLDWKDSGHIKVHPDPVSEGLLARIRKSAGDSPLLPDKAADVLIDQGFITLTD